MRLMHISDNHSLLVDYWSIMNIDLSTIDAIVHSGDMLPNWSRGIRAIEEPRQEQWLIENAERIKEWSKGLPILFVAGNHDFVDVPRILKSQGVNIIDLCKKDEEGNVQLVDFGGFRYYGHSWVPWFTGEWNYEVQESAEAIAIEAGLGLKPDIIVSHGPIKGVLDRNEHGDRCGSRQWAIQLKEAMLEMPPYIPKAFLHGHIHPANGVISWKSCLVSNAATTCNVIEIK